MVLGFLVIRRDRMAHQRKFFVGGNWKMNGSKASIDELVKLLNDKGLNPNTGSLTCLLFLPLLFAGKLATETPLLHVIVLIKFCQLIANWSDDIGIGNRRLTAPRNRAAVAVTLAFMGRSLPNLVLEWYIRHM